MQEHQENRKKNQQGFTLLEILVVVAIMGFLVAMVAPRFAGMVDGTRWTIADTDKTRGAQLISTFYEDKGRYPSGMVNLVMTDGSATIPTYQIPYVDNQEPEDGPEVLRYKHNNNHKFVIHHLNAAEAEELRSMGVTRMYNLNQYGDVLGSQGDGAPVAAGDTVGKPSGATHTGRTNNWEAVTVVDGAGMQPYMEEVSVEAGIGVAMALVGADDTTNVFDYVGTVKPPTAPDADKFGRIGLGLGPDSELVTSGMAENAGITPVATNTDNYTYDNYYFFLPRLAATSDRLQDAAENANLTNLVTGGPAEDFHGAFGTPGATYGQIVAVGFEKGSVPTRSQVNQACAGTLSQDDVQYSRKEVNLLEPHEQWDFMRFPLESDTRYSMCNSVPEL